MNSTDTDDRNVVGAAQDTLENDMSFLESLDNDQSNKVKINPAPEQPQDLYTNQQNTLANQLQEIEQIQQFLSEQAQILGQNVDSSFNTIGKAISTIANQLSGFGLIRGENAQQLQRFGNAMKNYAALAGTIAQVHAHNRNLEILLQTKQRYAQEYLNSVLWFKGRASQALQGQEQLLRLTTSTAFDSTKFDTPQKITELAASVKSTELMYRTTRYSLHMLEYLESEYNAWLGGYQHGSLPFPTLRTATISTIEVINHGHADNQHIKSLQEILSGDHQGRSVYGRDLLLLSAPHITAQTLLEIGGDTKPTDITDPYALDVDAVCDSVQNFAHEHFQPLIENNPALDGVDVESLEVRKHSRKGKGRLKALFFACVLFFALYLVASKQEADIIQLGVGLQWCINIAIVLIPLIFYKSIVSKTKKKRHEQDFLYRNRLRRHLLCLAGYQYRQERDTERKSYMSELRKTAWE